MTGKHAVDMYTVRRRQRTPAVVMRKHPASRSVRNDDWAIRLRFSSEICKQWERSSLTSWQLRVMDMSVMGLMFVQA